MDDDGNIVLDFDSVILPEGEYHVHISAVKLNRKKNATPEDFPYLEFHYYVESRVDGQEIAPELVGQDIMDICSLNPTARWKLKSVLEAFTCEPWEEKKMTINPDELTGTSAIALVVHDSYNGVQRAKATKVYNPDFVPPEKPVDAPSEDVWDDFNHKD
jgi:hypothetical protein